MRSPSFSHSPSYLNSSSICGDSREWMIELLFSVQIKRKGRGLKTTLSHRLCNPLLLVSTCVGQWVGIAGEHCEHCSELFSAAETLLNVPGRSLEIFILGQNFTPHSTTTPLLSFHSFLSEFAMAATAPPTTVGSTKLDGLAHTAASKEPQKLSGINLYSRFVRLPCCAYDKYNANNVRPSLAQSAAQ
jgi:hypothetical protein